MRLVSPKTWAHRMISAAHERCWMRSAFKKDRLSTNWRTRREPDTGLQPHPPRSEEMMQTCWITPCSTFCRPQTEPQTCSFSRRSHDASLTSKSSNTVNQPQHTLSKPTPDTNVSCASRIQTGSSRVIYEFVFVSKQVQLAQLSRSTIYQKRRRFFFLANFQSPTVGWFGRRMT